MSIEHHFHEETRVPREKPQTLLHQIVSKNFSRIGTVCKGRWKSNYHMIAAMTAPKSLYNCKEYSIKKFAQIKYSGYENQDLVQA